MPVLQWKTSDVFYKITIDKMIVYILQRGIFTGYSTSVVGGQQ